MPTFAYTFRDAMGTVRSGTSEAESAEILRKRLQEQGFTVTEVRQIRAHRPGGGWGRVKLSDLAIFCRQFSTMQDAGVSIVRSLDVLAQQTQSAKLRRIIMDLQAEVEAGQTLSKAMSKYPNVFSNLFIGLIRAGEVGGVLEESLQRLAAFLEADVALRRKVRAAMTYPTIVVIAALAIVIGLVTFILPKFFDVFRDLNIKEFPVMTQMLMDFSNFLTSRWYVMIAIVVLVVMAFRMFVRTRIGRRLYDRLKLKLPVFGPLNHKIALARFSRTLSTLLSSGVPILQALETVAGTVANEIIADAVLEARARIREGDRIGPPLEKSGMFPPMVVHMISIGEESGALDQMLSKVADFYESEVESTLQSLTSAIEPVLIVLLGGMVGFIVISLLLPLVTAVQSLAGGQGGAEGG
jgi:type IV pilus assembly protein PilC